MENILQTTENTVTNQPTSGFHQFLEGKYSDKQVKETVKKALDIVTDKPKKDNNKKLAAEKIFNANKQLNNGEIARMISSELQITYANAYYYVTRVFRKQP